MIKANKIDDKHMQAVWQTKSGKECRAELVPFPTGHLGMSYHLLDKLTIIELYYLQEYHAPGTPSVQGEELDNPLVAVAFDDPASIGSLAESLLRVYQKRKEMDSGAD